MSRGKFLSYNRDHSAKPQMSYQWIHVGHFLLGLSRFFITVEHFWRVGMSRRIFLWSHLRVDVQSTGFTNNLFTALISYPHISNKEIVYFLIIDPLWVVHCLRGSWMRKWDVIFHLIWMLNNIMKTALY